MGAAEWVLGRGAPQQTPTQTKRKAVWACSRLHATMPEVLSKTDCLFDPRLSAFIWRPIQRESLLHRNIKCILPLVGGKTQRRHHRRRELQRNVDAYLALRWRRGCFFEEDYVIARREALAEDIGAVVLDVGRIA